MNDKLSTIDVLTHERDQLIDAIEVLPDGFVLYDADDRLILCNEKYREFYSESAELIESGRTFEEIIRLGVARGQYADAVGREDAWIAERMDNHKNPHAPIEQQLGDGRWLRIEERKTRDGGIVGFRIDITELKMREESLRMSEARMRATVETAIDCIVMIDAHGRIIEFNPAAEACFGYSRKFAIGRDLADLIVPERHRTAHLDGLRRFLETGEPSILGRRIEVEALRADGSEFTVELGVEATENEEGLVFVAYLRDITDRREIEFALRDAKDQAVAANNAKAGFLAVMSHEIRTPLNGVLGVLSLLTDTKLNEEQAGLVNTGQTSGEGLLEIISDILDFSKMEAGKLKFEDNAFALRPLIQTVFDMVAARADDKGIGLALKMDGHVTEFVQSDSGRLRQVILNLVSNAVKFTETGGVDVVVEPAGAGDGTSLIRFSVTDTGIGIPREKHADVFNEFVTLDTAYSRKYGGTGLGLAISRRIVDVMGGSIGFESAEGHGSTFWFVVPLPAAEDPGTMLAESPTASVMPRRRLNILVTEDNPTNRMVARSMLVSAGHHVDTAANGLEAVKALEARSYDAILMDVSMPEMDGLEATRKIRGLAHDRGRLPIIGMTAHAMVGDRESFIAAGMDDYIAKPARKTEILETLAKWTSDREGIHSKVSTQVPPAVSVALDLSVLHDLIEETEPGMVPQLIEIFIEDGKRRLREIGAAFESENFETIGNVCHTLSGSASMLGAMQFHTVAQRIEELCGENSPKMAPTLQRELEDAADVAFQALEDFRQGQIT